LGFLLLGHGGRQIAEFLEEALEKNIEVELKHPDEADVKERLTRSVIVCIAVLSSRNHRSIFNFILLFRAFLITDMHSRKREIVTSGATVVSALIKSNEDGSARTLYVANCGDSRAVLAVDKPQQSE
jgi:serine/threonine protein phosphatase PrpC